ncbi:unnamed protein product [Ranitomeya imitator]|uniref:Uncharacterized protein n=1 Tax=Ranitomeya imitator TaxID=111125 RepID=A0ABN9LRP6_9NEOB|nr:unnamed protein product [Ranitomeya imitator]
MQPAVLGDLFLPQLNDLHLLASITAMAQLSMELLSPNSTGEDSFVQRTPTSTIEKRLDFWAWQYHQIINKLMMAISLGSTVAQWLALQPCSAGVLGSNPTQDNICKEFHGIQGKHRVTKRGPALSYPIFTLVTGIVGRWRAVFVTALQRPNSDAAAIRIVVGIAAASLNVADYIVDESQNSTSDRGTELEDLIGMLSSDPFLSRKEIPRTPENLNIRTSWRKAIQTEEFSDVSSPLEVRDTESPAELESAHCSQIDLSMACFLSTSHLSEQNESPGPPVATGALMSTSLKEAPLNQSALHLPTSALLPENDNLKPSEQSRMFSPLVENDQAHLLERQSSRKIMDSTILLASLKLENASAHTTLSWNSSTAADYNNCLDSHEEIQFGILHETLPEGAGNVSLNSTTSLETSETHKNISRGDQLLLNSNSMDRKLDIDSIRSRYEALKKTLSASLLDDETDHYRVPLYKFGKHKSESNLLADSGNAFSPLDKGLVLNLEHSMTQSPKGRRFSLPQLISFSPAEDVHVRRLEELSDVFDSRDSGALNETIDLPPPELDPQTCTDEGEGQLIKLES